jgi:hypothetical protein
MEILIIKKIWKVFDRLDRLVALIGDKKIRDVSRQDVVAAIDRISDGHWKGRTAKQLAGEELVHPRKSFHREGRQGRQGKQRSKYCL